MFHVTSSSAVSSSPLASRIDLRSPRSYTSIVSLKISTLYLRVTHTCFRCVEVDVPGNVFIGCCFFTSCTDCVVANESGFCSHKKANLCQILCCFILQEKRKWYKRMLRLTCYGSCSRHWYSSTDCCEEETKHQCCGSHFEFDDNFLNKNIRKVVR